VVATRDGGRSWSAVGAPSAPLAPPGEPGVTEIRFADGLHGWAYGPSLYRTVDGGRHWRAEAIPGGGTQVLSVATDAGWVYAAVSPCELGQGTYQCTKPSTVWRASVWGSEWQPVPVTLPVTLSAFVSAGGGATYVYVPQVGAADLFFASTDGRRWSARTSPCSKPEDSALTDVVALPRHHAALLCVGDPGFSKAVKQVYRSTDAAKTVTSAGTLPVWGVRSGLAATPDSATLVVTSSSIGSWIYRDTGGTAWSTPVAHPNDQAGWNDPVFTTNTTGYVVYDPATNPSPEGSGVLMATHDGGAHWAAVPLG
jgi:photosystem II stability/assembly factor-like uncharacterized protein